MRANNMLSAITYLTHRESYTCSYRAYRCKKKKNPWALSKVNYPLWPSLPFGLRTLTSPLCLCMSKDEKFAIKCVY